MTSSPAQPGKNVLINAADYNDDDLIYLWPDGTWCLKEDLEEYLSFMSDDFEVRHYIDLLLELEEKAE